MVASLAVLAGAALTNSLTADMTFVSANGFGATQVATITSIASTTFTYTLLSGATGGRVTLGPTSGPTATVRVSAPSSGNGTVSGVYRVTAANGNFIDITFNATWGTG